MSGLDKIASFNDIKNLVTVDPIEINAPASKTLSKKHKASISKAKKDFYQTKKGKDTKKKQSQKMREYYRTEAGKELLQKLKQKKGTNESAKAISKPIRIKIVNQYKEGKPIKELAEEYNVSRTTIHRYIKEFI